MRLNCALVPSFLFVSAVLAGNHQPPFLDLVEESINSTDFVIDNWAGAMSQEGDDNYAAATFLVPRATRSAYGGSSFDIVVGINGRTCRQFIISVGITVKSQGGPSTYEAWAQGFDGEKMILPSGSFPIHIGDEMRARVEIESPTSGSFDLFNVDTGQSWDLSVSGKNMDCHYSDAAWIVTTTSVPNRLPMFRPVAFIDISTGPGLMPVVPNKYILRNIQQPGKTITATVIDGPYIVIVRLPR